MVEVRAAEERGEGGLGAVKEEGREGAAKEEGREGAAREEGRAAEAVVEERVEEAREAVMMTPWAAPYFLGPCHLPGPCRS